MIKRCFDFKNLIKKQKLDDYNIILKIGGVSPFFKTRQFMIKVIKIEFQMFHLTCFTK